MIRGISAYIRNSMASTALDQTNAGTDGMFKNLRLMIRATIELFVTLEDFHFLFHELFLPFN